MKKDFIYLASASPRRRALLEQIGVAYRALPAAIGEELRPGEGAERYVVRLAEAKAAAVWARTAAADSIVLTSGRVIEADHAWIEGTDIRYVRNDTVYAVPRGLVARVEAADGGPGLEDPDVRKSRERLAAGQAEDALRYARLALFRQPQSVSALQALAAAQIALGDSPRAQQTVEQALALEPGSPLSRELLGDALVEAGDFAAAREQYRLAAEAAPQPRVHKKLEALGPVICQTALGDLGLFRVTRPGPIPVYGPDDPATMRRVLASLDEQSGGLALVDGGWERRGFAAPDVAQGVILVVGSGYSAHPDRSAAAMRYVVEILGLPRADGPALRAFHDGAGRGATTILDAQGRTLSAVVETDDELLSHLEGLGDRAATVVLPDALSDALLGRLVRNAARCVLVVRDPTAVHVAPVYYKAWVKVGGAVRVVEPMCVLAVATNPVNRSGPDADAEGFRTAVARAIPELPVHDVVLEAARAKRRPFWRFLGLS